MLLLWLLQTIYKKSYVLLKWHIVDNLEWLLILLWHMVSGTVQYMHIYQYVQNPIQSMLLDVGSILGLPANL